MVLILADSVAGSQWVIGQKGIEVANMNDRWDADKTMPGTWPGIIVYADCVNRCNPTSPPCSAEPGRVSPGSNTAEL